MKTLWTEIRDLVVEFGRQFFSREGLIITMFIAIVCLRQLAHSSDWIGPMLQQVWVFGPRAAARSRSTSILFHGLATFLVIVVLHRENPFREFGLGLPPARWIWFTLAIFAVQLLFIPYAASLSSIQGHYPLLRAARHPGEVFWQWQAVAFGSKLAWEFFVRGYLMLGLAKRFGIWAVFIQNIPFVVLHTGKPPVELMFSFADGLALGLLVYACRSVWPAVWLHGLGALALDYYLVYLM